MLSGLFQNTEPHSRDLRGKYTSGPIRSAAEQNLVRQIEWPSQNKALRVNIALRVLGV